MNNLLTKSFMKQVNFEWSQSYLNEVRKAFEPRYGEKVIHIANNLHQYAVICYDSWKRKIIKEEDNEIRTGKNMKIKVIPHIEQSRDRQNWGFLFSRQMFLSRSSRQSADRFPRRPYSLL